MPAYKPLNNTAYEHLRAMIYNSELEFHRIYSETKLAAELSISRTPIRDALNRLAQERYIDILPSRGFMLHTPTQSDITEAYHVRMMTEGYCGEIVARDFPGARALATVARMEEALERQRRLLEDGGSYSLGEFWLDDLDFHKSLLEYMGISLLIVQYESFMHFFMPQHLIEDSDLHQLQPRTLARHRSTLIEHEAILEALKSREPERVRPTIRAHLDTSLRMLASLNKS